MRSRMLLGVGLLVAVPALLAAERLNVKTGLWEITSVTRISGLPPLPKEVAEKMTPQQRAELQAAMKNQEAKGPETDVDRECITAKDIENPFSSADEENCNQTIVTTTRTTQEVRLACSGEHPSTGLLRVTTPTPTTMTGLLDLRSGDGKDAFRITADMKGRWLGPDCGEEAESDDEETVDDEEPIQE